MHHSRTAFDMAGARMGPEPSEETLRNLKTPIPANHDRIANPDEAIQRIKNFLARHDGEIRNALMPRDAE